MYQGEAGDRFKHCISIELKVPAGHQCFDRHVFRNHVIFIVDYIKRSYMTFALLSLVANKPCLLTNNEGDLNDSLKLVFSASRKWYQTVISALENPNGMSQFPQ